MKKQLIPAIATIFTLGLAGAAMAAPLGFSANINGNYGQLPATEVMRGFSDQVPRLCGLATSNSLDVIGCVNPSKGRLVIATDISNAEFNRVYRRLNRALRNDQELVITGSVGADYHNSYQDRPYYWSNPGLHFNYSLGF